MNKFELGDYVIVSNPDPDTDYGPDETFEVVGFTENRFGRPLVEVARIDRPRWITVFYPHELSREG